MAKNSRKALVLVIIGSVVIAGIWLANPWRPRVEGHTLDYWADHLLVWKNEAKWEENPKAAEILTALGAESIPSLRSLLHRKESWHSSRIERWRYRVPSSLRKFLPKREIDLVSLQSAGIDLLGRIGKEANEITPDLVAILNGSSLELRIRAAKALGSIAPRSRYEVQAIEALVAAINGAPRQNKAVLIGVTESLAKFGAAAKAAVPVLSPLTQEPIFEAKFIQSAIGLIDPKAADAFKIPRGPKERAVLAIKDFGGFLEYDQSGEVSEINLVYHEDASGTRRECHNPSDKVSMYFEDFPALRKLFIQKSQATDWAMQYVGRLEQLNTLMMWDAEVSDKGVGLLQNLRELRYLHLSNAGITDHSLFVLSTLRDLKSMSLQGNHFTDEGLRHLKGMTQLETLWLGLGNAEGMTDVGMTFIGSLGNLKTLELQHSRITDEGLEELQGLKKLEKLFVGGTAVTSNGISKIKVSIPGLEVHR